MNRGRASGPSPVLAVVISLLVSVGLLAAIATTHANAKPRAGYCSPTGDFCYGVMKKAGRTKLTFQTFSFSGKIRVCATNQSDFSRLCADSTLKTGDHDIYTASLDFKNQFQSPEAGRYCAKFSYQGQSLGPRVCFDYEG